MRGAWLAGCLADGLSRAAFGYPRPARERMNGVHLVRHRAGEAFVAVVMRPSRDLSRVCGVRCARHTRYMYVDEG